MTMRFHPTRLGAAALIAALGASACSLPNEPATTAAAEASEPFSSGEILQVMRSVNRGEIEQARLALRNSDNPQVRQAAQMIIDDHTTSNQRIMALAQEQGLELEDSPLSEGIAAQAGEIRDELAELSGAEFDRTFLQRQAELHEIVLDTVRNQLMPDANDPQVRQLLTAATPKLEQHLTEAEAKHAEVRERAPRG